MHRKGVEHSFRSSTTLRSDRNAHVDTAPGVLWWWSLLVALGDHDIEATQWHDCPPRGWLA